MSIIKTAAVEETKKALRERTFGEKAGGAALIGGSLMLGSDVGEPKAVMNYDPTEKKAPKNAVQKAKKVGGNKFGRLAFLGSRAGKLFK